MATSTTLNAADLEKNPAPNPTTPAEMDLADESSKKEKTEFAYPKPSTDFFAYSSLSGEEDRQCQINNFDLHQKTDEENGADKSLCQNFLDIFPPRRIQGTDVCFKISPAIGAVCYEYFSLSVMNPQWFSKAFGESESAVKNAFWYNAHIGCGLYLYSRRHIRNVGFWRALCYSLFGSMLFNFGSLMCWGWARQMLPPCGVVRTGFGLLTGGILLYAAQDYLQYVDNSCSQVD